MSTGGRACGNESTPRFWAAAHQLSAYAGVKLLIPNEPAIAAAVESVRDVGLLYTATAAPCCIADRSCSPTEIACPQPRSVRGGSFLVASCHEA